MHADLDGNQVLDFYWTDAVDAMKRSVAKLQYKDKLYTTFSSLEHLQWNPRHWGLIRPTQA
jgi:hypothetical protein